MKYTEEKIATYSQKNVRIQMLKITYDNQLIKYQLRINRKVVKTNLFEYPIRKLFAVECQNIILQLKIY